MPNPLLKAAFACLCVVPASAQSVMHLDASGDVYERQRPFALVLNSSAVTVNGDWHGIASLTRYTHDHPGSYIVFVQEGALHRLDTPDRVTQAGKLYAPMLLLAAKQEALAAKGKPLAEQQRALAAEQRAVVDPAEKGRIGALQGEVGERQGAIGARQGEIGRQQGEVGRAFYDRVQTLLDACLADGSCPRVTGDAAQR